MSRQKYTRTLPGPLVCQLNFFHVYYIVAVIQFNLSLLFCATYQKINFPWKRKQGSDCISAYDYMWPTLKLFVFRKTCEANQCVSYKLTYLWLEGSALTALFPAVSVLSLLTCAAGQRISVWMRGMREDKLMSGVMSSWPWFLCFIKSNQTDGGEVGCKLR